MLNGDSHLAIQTPDAVWSRVMAQIETSLEQELAHNCIKENTI